MEVYSSASDDSVVPKDFAPRPTALLNSSVDLNSIMRDYENLMQTLSKRDRAPNIGPSAVSTTSTEGRAAPTNAAAIVLTQEKKISTPNLVPALHNQSSIAGVGYSTLKYAYNLPHNEVESVRPGKRESESPIPPAPPVEGLTSVLSALHEADKRANLARDDIEIVRAEGEAAVAEMRLEVQRLQMKLRALLSQRGLEEV
jgi:hypothetical protein